METVFKLSARLVVTLAVYANGLFAQAQTQAPAKPSGGCGELAEAKARREGQEKRMKDWPDLTHYRDANAEVAAPAKDEQRVVFMGDSITDMWVLPQLGGFFPGKPYNGSEYSFQGQFGREQVDVIPDVLYLEGGANREAGLSDYTRAESALRARSRNVVQRQTIPERYQFLTVRKLAFDSIRS